MKRDERATPSERPEQITYERPRIEDYGTLAQLTASKGPNQADFLGGRDDGGGGGYS
jgi:hypothetical protein